MTKKGRVFRSQWASQVPSTPAEPTDTRLERAKKLPRFGPGIVIRTPLSLWPEYQQLYHLEPRGIREPASKPTDGPGEATLLVKRISKGAE